MAIFAYDIGLKKKFRGLTRRNGLLFFGPAGWAEFSPFWDYDVPQSIPWLRAALEQATVEIPAQTPVDRADIGINLTIGPWPAEQAFTWVQSHPGYHTVKVKVAGQPDSQAADLARLEAVRAALGPAGKIRIDGNCGWELDEAARLLPCYDRAAGGLEYAEQPVAGAAAMAALRRLVQVPLAADESLRLAADPLEVRRLGAADVAILKVQPLGGVKAAATLAAELGLPAVVSSALETSIGLRAGLQLAGLLPGELACGLGTAALFQADVVTASLLPNGGLLPALPPAPEILPPADWQAAPPLQAKWEQRLQDCAAEAKIDLAPIYDTKLPVC